MSSLPVATVDRARKRIARAKALPAVGRESRCQRSGVRGEGISDWRFQIADKNTNYRRHIGLPALGFALQGFAQEQLDVGLVSDTLPRGQPTRRIDIFCG